MNIPANLFVHPFIGGTAVLLIITSYALKGGGRKFQTYHYWAGWSAWVVMTFGIGFGFFAVSRIDETVEEFLFSLSTISMHFYWGLLMWLAMSVQTFWGEAMRRNPKRIMRFRTYHKTLSQILLVAILVLAVLGVPITYSLFQGAALYQGIWVGLALAVFGGAVSVLWNVETNALIPRRRSRPVRVIQRDQPINKMRVFPEQRFVDIAGNESILRANLRSGILHTHVCGGNARCSTCRIMVLAGIDNFKPRNPAEQRLADQLEFSDRVRLACQSRITGEVTIRRLVLDEFDIEIVNQLEENAQPRAAGHEEDLAVLFSDIRGFTRFSEDQLPYDVIHALNRYYRQMGQIVSDHKGEVLNYMGDGMMAVFSKQHSDHPSWQAVQAAVQMFAEMGDVQTYFKEHYDYHVDIGVGIHYGPAVVGDVGAEGQKQHTAIGDTVNYASRVESANKEIGTRLLVSQEVYEQVSARVKVGRTHRFIPKGKTGEYTLYEILGLN